MTASIANIGVTSVTLQRRRRAAHGTFDDVAVAHGRGGTGDDQELVVVEARDVKSLS